MRISISASSRSSLHIFARASILTLAALLTAVTSLAQSSNNRKSDRANTDALHRLNDAIESLVNRVSPSVVQILVTGYGTAEAGDSNQTSLVIARQRKIGSGVIVDPSGYIVTNAHVVSGAERIEVIVSAPSPDAPPDPIIGSQGQSFEARIVGQSAEVDLAVIKIEDEHLPAVSVTTAIEPQQGEMVFAFGSPGGLRNSVTMGVVSAVSRQADPSSPLVYIQTDTPINPGNSGGPLVDADGRLIGINTFIISASGGNEGLGFAIPASLVSMVYPQLLKFGHIHQPEIGVTVQAITPELASALSLPRDYGLIVVDVQPDSPADHAGIKIQDIVTSVDGNLVASLPLLMHDLYMHKRGDHMKVAVLRGTQPMQFDMQVTEQPHNVDKLAELANSERNLVKRLGILGVDLTPDMAQMLPQLRIQSGVIVAARTAGASSEIPLATGDVIHGVNAKSVSNLEELRAALSAVKPGGAIALQIERDSKLSYIVFQLE